MESRTRLECLAPNDRCRVIRWEETPIINEQRQVVRRDSAVGRKGCDNVHFAIGDCLVHQSCVNISHLAELESVGFAESRLSVGKFAELRATCLAVSASKPDNTVLLETPANSYASGIMDQGPLRKTSIAIAVHPLSRRITLVFVVFAACFSLIPQWTPSGTTP